MEQNLAAGFKSVDLRWLRRPEHHGLREAKYASKIKEKDYETWCAKNREKRRKCIDSINEQKREEMKRRDRQGEEKRKKSS